MTLQPEPEPEPVTEGGSRAGRGDAVGCCLCGTGQGGTPNRFPTVAVGEVPKRRAGFKTSGTLSPSPGRPVPGSPNRAPRPGSPSPWPWSSPSLSSRSAADHEHASPTRQPQHSSPRRSPPAPWLTEDTDRRPSRRPDSPRGWGPSPGNLPRPPSPGIVFPTHWPCATSSPGPLTGARPPSPGAPMGHTDGVGTIPLTAPTVALTWQCRNTSTRKCPALRCHPDPRGGPPPRPSQRH